MWINAVKKKMVCIPEILYAFTGPTSVDRKIYIAEEVKLYYADR